jgi:NitT/TauT family transport system substrate-binding protein
MTGEKVKKSKLRLVAAGALAAVLGLSMVACSSTTPPGSTDSPAQAPVKLTFQLNYTPNAAFAPYVVAQEKGYFKKEGLDVTMLQGTGSGGALKAIAAGQADVAIADSGVMVNAVQGGGKFTMIQMLADTGVQNVYTRVGSGINDMKDLVGKTIGAAPDDAGRLLMPAVAKAQGFDVNKIDWVDVPAATKYSLLAGGKIDAIFDIAQNAPLVYQALGGKANTKKFSFASAGVNLYSQGIVVTNDRLAKDSDTFERFTYAIRKGWAYAIKDPDGAMNIYHAAFPSVDIAAGVDTLKIWASLMETKNYKTNGIGWIDEDRWISTVDTVQKYFAIPAGGSPISEASSLFTDKLLKRKVALP